MKKFLLSSFLTIFFNLSVFSDEYIYLGCEESAETTVKDLLNNKTLKPLSKRQKKKMKKFFDYEINNRYSDYLRKQVIAGETKMPINLAVTWLGRKDIRFHTFKISKRTDTGSKVEVCRSYGGRDINSPNFCHEYEKNTENYIREEYTPGESKTFKINRETLLFTERVHYPTPYTTKFQCHVLSAKNELEILYQNHINYIKPLQDEWNVNIANFLKQERELEERNKI